MHRKQTSLAKAASRNEPTPRQIQVLRALRDSCDSDGYNCSMRELADRLGINSTNAIVEHFAALEAKGLITRKRHTARAVRVTPHGRSFLGGAL